MIAARSTASLLLLLLSLVFLSIIVSIGMRVVKCLKFTPRKMFVVGAYRRKFSQNPLHNLQGIVYFTRCALLCCFKFIHTLDSIIQSSSCMYIRMKKLECLSLMFSTMCTPSSYDSNLLEHISSTSVSYIYEKPDISYL